MAADAPLPPAAADAAPTPLLAAGEVLLKCEHLNPTGSFKDRVAARAFELGAAAGAAGWVGSSSGNAGAAFAAAGARAGLPGVLFTVASIRPEQLAHIAAYGTRVVVVEGYGRDAAVDARVLDTLTALARERRLVLGITARACNAAAMDGLRAIAAELVAQLGRVPGAVYVPTGGGGLLATLALGFEELVADGRTDRVPQLVAVQSAGCSPIHDAWVAGAEHVSPCDRSTATLAAIGLPRPPDGDLALAAVRDSGGLCVALDDALAWEARDELATRFGVLAEPAAALAYAGYRAHPLPDAVVVLTGAGPKHLRRDDAPLTPDLVTADRITDAVRLG